MNTTNKPLPDALKKQQFYKLYSKVPERTLRKRINAIIYDFRKGYSENQGKTFKDIVNTQTVEKKELLEYARTYFFPAGYYDDEEESNN